MYTINNENRYDQRNFLGRVAHFFDVIDPTTLFTTDQQLNQALQLLQKQKEREAQGLSFHSQHSTSIA